MEELRFENCEEIVIEKKDYSGVKKLIIKGCECTVSAGAFEGCTSLEEIVIENSSIVFEACSFRDCTSLKTIKCINDGDDNSGWIAFMNYSFSGCTSLESVKLYDDSGEDCEMGEGAFKGCTSLKAFIFRHYGCLDVKGSAFEGCTSLLNFKSDGFTSFGPYVFKGCPSSLTIAIPVNNSCDARWLDGYDGNPCVMFYECVDCEYGGAWNEDGDYEMCDCECDEIRSNSCRLRNYNRIFDNVEFCYGSRMDFDEFSFS